MGEVPRGLSQIYYCIDWHELVENEEGEERVEKKEYNSEIRGRAEDAGEDY
jgi:hypothetical protein